VTTIRVELIEGATQQLLGAADLPVDQLPETFAVATTMHLRGDDWHVEHAEPMTRDEYLATGRLRIVLRKVERVDPKKILFSLPTLETTMPPMRDGDASAAFVIHEDDWRQHELVAERFAPEIAVELEAIRVVLGERQGVGFARLHVRERIPEPLAGVELRLPDVRAAIGGDVARRELAFSGTAGVVDGGFAFVVGDAGAVYGREHGDRVVALGFARGVEPTAFAPLAKAHALAIVDWCRARSR
jgi:hypothetical protein